MSCHCVPAPKQILVLTVVIKTGNKSGLVGIEQKEGACLTLALGHAVVSNLTGFICFHSPACLVLVCPKHVFLEQHLLQPGRPDEPAGGVFLSI